MSDKEFLDRLNYFRSIYNYSNYRFSKLTDIPVSTLYSMDNHYSVPTMHTFLTFCDGFGITPCEFFLQDCDDTLTISGDTKKILKNITLLSPENKRLVQDIIRAYEKYYSDSRRGGREAPRPLRREDHRR